MFARRTPHITTHYCNLPAAGKVWSNLSLSVAIWIC